MAKSLDFYQIIYEEKQREKCYPFAKVYFNETVTDYFENSVISHLVPDSQADLISVCSWRLSQKRGDSSTPIVLGGDLSLTEEKILGQDYDIAVLTPRSHRHQPLLMASQWHGKAWDNAFNLLRKDFFPTVGIKIKSELTKATYENHFIARREIYQAYVNDCLNPAIKFMDRSVKDKKYRLKDGTEVDGSIFEVESGYRRRKPPKEVANYMDKSGRFDWPISVFILERLFSCWIEGKGFKIVNL